MAVPEDNPVGEEGAGGGPRPEGADAEAPPTSGEARDSAWEAREAVGLGFVDVLVANCLRTCLLGPQFLSDQLRARKRTFSKARAVQGLGTSSQLQEAVETRWFQLIILVIGCVILIVDLPEFGQFASMGMPKFAFYRFTALEVRDRAIPAAPGVARVGVHGREGSADTALFYDVAACRTELRVRVVEQQGPSITFTVECGKDSHRCGVKHDGWFFQTGGDPSKDPTRFVLEGSDDMQEWEVVGASWVMRRTGSMTFRPDLAFDTPMERGVSVRYRVRGAWHMTLMSLGWSIAGAGVLVILLAGLSGRSHRTHEILYIWSSLCGACGVCALLMRGFEDASDPLTVTGADWRDYVRYGRLTLISVLLPGGAWALKYHQAANMLTLAIVNLAADIVIEGSRFGGHWGDSVPLLLSVAAMGFVARSYLQRQRVARLAAQDLRAYRGVWEAAQRQEGFEQGLQLLQGAVAELRKGGRREKRVRHMRRVQKQHLSHAHAEQDPVAADGSGDALDISGSSRRKASLSEGLERRSSVSTSLLKGSLPWRQLQTRDSFAASHDGAPPEPGGAFSKQAQSMPARLSADAPPAGLGWGGEQRRSPSDHQASPPMPTLLPPQIRRASLGDPAAELPILRAAGAGVGLLDQPTATDRAPSAAAGNSSVTHFQTRSRRRSVDSQSAAESPVAGIVGRESGSSRLGPEEDLDVLFCQASLLQQKLLRCTARHAAASGGLFPVRPAQGAGPPTEFVRWDGVESPEALMLGGLKPLKRCLQKADVRYSGRPSYLLDLCRTRVAFETPADMASFVQSLGRDLSVVVMRVRSNMAEGLLGDGSPAAGAPPAGGHGVGYRFVSVSVRMVDSETVRACADLHVCELLLELRCFAEVRTADSHARYIMGKNLQGSSQSVHQAKGRPLDFLWRARSRSRSSEKGFLPSLSWVLRWRLRSSRAVRPLPLPLGGLDQGDLDYNLTGPETPSSSVEGGFSLFERHLHPRSGGTGGRQPPLVRMGSFLKTLSSKKPRPMHLEDDESQSQGGGGRDSFYGDESFVSPAPRHRSSRRKISLGVARGAGSDLPNQVLDEGLRTGFSDPNGGTVSTGSLEADSGQSAETSWGLSIPSSTLRALERMIKISARGQRGNHDDVLLHYERGIKNASIMSVMYTSKPLTLASNYSIWQLFFVFLGMSLFVSLPFAHEQQANNNLMNPVPEFRHYRMNVLETRAGGVPVAPGVSSFGVIADDGCLLGTQRRAIGGAEVESWDDFGINTSRAVGSVVRGSSYTISFSEVVRMRGYFVITDSDGSSVDDDPARFEILGSNGDGDDEDSWVLVWKPVFHALLPLFSSSMLSDARVELLTQRSMIVEFDTSFSVPMELFLLWRRYAMGTALMLYALLGRLKMSVWAVLVLRIGTFLTVVSSVVSVYGFALSGQTTHAFEVTCQGAAYVVTLLAIIDERRLRKWLLIVSTVDVCAQLVLDLVVFQGRNETQKVRTPLIGAFFFSWFGLYLILRRVALYKATIAVREDEATYDRIWEGMLAQKDVCDSLRHLEQVVRMIGLDKKSKCVQLSRKAGGVLPFSHKLMTQHFKFQRHQSVLGFLPVLMLANQRDFRNPMKSLEVLYAQAHIVQGLLLEKARHWASETGGLFIDKVTRKVANKVSGEHSNLAWVGVKKTSRALEKLMRLYGDNVSRLLDLSRCAIYFDSVQELTMCLGSIIIDDSVYVERVKNRMAIGSSAKENAGYRDLLINLRIIHPLAIALGVELHVCEFQLVLRQFGDLKHGKGHDNYVDFRKFRAS